MLTTAIKLYSTFSLRRPMGDWPSASSRHDENSRERGMAERGTGALCTV